MWNLSLDQHLGWNYLRSWLLRRKRRLRRRRQWWSPLPLGGQNPSTSEDYRSDLHVALLLVETTSSLTVRHLLFHPDHHRNCLYPTPV
jgi:hypothetical protein